MAHLIAPILVDGVLKCCQPGLGRTTATLAGDANEIAANSWEVYRATAFGDPGSNPDAESAEVGEGSVIFGICCGNQIELELEGQIETLNSGFDNIEVLLNGVQQFFFESIGTSTDPWAATPAGPFNVAIPLPDRPCGNVIEITGSTIDTIANNDVYWNATIVGIT